MARASPTAAARSLAAENGWTRWGSVMAWMGISAETTLAFGTTEPRSSYRGNRPVA